MSDHLTLAIDAGTSVNKALLFNDDGKLIAESSKEIEIERPHPMWAEQDPLLIWKITCENIRQVIKNAGVKSEEIGAVGLTGNMHGTILIDSRKKLMRSRAIIWLDRRTQDMISIFNKDGTSDMIFKVSGWVAMPSMQIFHLRWLIENETEKVKNSACFLTIKDYIRLRLTGEAYTDLTDASFTGLFDNKNQRWSEELFELLSIPRSLAPEVRNPWEIGGSVCKEAARETGLKEGTCVSVGCGDVAAMALGSGVINENQLIANIGTAGVYERPVMEPKYDERRCFTIAAHAVPNRWLLQTNQMSAGLALKWFRDTLFRDKSYRELDELAAKSTTGSGGVMFHPFLQGERSPFVNPDARALFFGLSITNSLNDLIRSVFEGIAFSARDNLDVLRLGKEFKDFEVIMTGGGANSNIWAQILADTLGTVVKVPKITEVAAFGAMMLAKIGLRIYKNYEEAVQKLIVFERVFHPDLEKTSKYLRLFKIYQDLYKTLIPFYEKLKVALS